MSLFEIHLINRTMIAYAYGLWHTAHFLHFFRFWQFTILLLLHWNGECNKSITVESRENYFQKPRCHDCEDDPEDLGSVYTLQGAWSNKASSS